jgi:hypothetical protein
MDLLDEFDLRCEFPSIGGAFGELRRYVRAVHHFLPHSSAQQAVRLQARITRELDPVTAGELEHDLEVVINDEQVTLPRVVWGGVMVSVFATYENGARLALRHWQRTTTHTVEFRVLPRKDFLKSAEAYAKEHIGVPLFSSAFERDALWDLKAFRNSFAHGSGLLSDLSNRLQLAIAAKDRHAGVAMMVSEGQWVSNARSSAYYLLVAERSAKRFGETILEKCIEHHRQRPRDA